ncbi:hypothetical protein J7J59_00320 [Candidatus Aerophobetes bacterium]|nr:hypothetical protein [Candidatus Aerophobetes bacterium]
MGKEDIRTGCPVIKVRGETLPEVWEKSVVRCWEEGIEVRTEYDRPEDPPSKDCTMIMEVNYPLKEPRLHRAFPAGLSDLEVYREEVLLGVHDDWINPEEGKWEYTYHERLFNYKLSFEEKGIDQIEFIVRKLSRTPYSRRAQAVTWKAWLDPNFDHPPCLQRLWFRIFGNSLQLNVHMRSNDAFKAAFMNMFAFTELQRLVAERISERTGKKINVGKYVHISDSYHIYGSYYEEFKGFLDTLKKRSFEERTWPTSFAKPFFEEGKKRIEREKRGNL